MKVLQRRKVSKKKELDLGDCLVMNIEVTVLTSRLWQDDIVREILSDVGLPLVLGVLKRNNQNILATHERSDITNKDHAVS